MFFNNKIQLVLFDSLFEKILFIMLMRWVLVGINGLDGDYGILNRLNMLSIVLGWINIGVRYIYDLLFISYGLDRLLNGLDSILINRTFFL